MKKKNAQPAKLGASQLVELGYRPRRPSLGAKHDGPDMTSVGIGLVLAGVGVGVVTDAIPEGRFREDAPKVALLGGGILLVLHGIGII